MSIIAWDGTSIAADKRSVHEGLIRTTTKLFRYEDCVYGYVGNQAQGLALCWWFRNGCDKDNYPEFQSTDNWTRLIVAKSSGCWVYESVPYPIEMEDPYMAWGSGRDFALAAMHLGQNAADAVKAVCVFDANCGNGTDIFVL